MRRSDGDTSDGGDVAGDDEQLACGWLAGWCLLLLLDDDAVRRCLEFVRGVVDEASPLRHLGVRVYIPAMHA